MNRPTHLWASVNQIINQSQKLFSANWVKVLLYTAFRKMYLNQVQLKAGCFHPWLWKIDKDINDNCIIKISFDFILIFDLSPLDDVLWIFAELNEINSKLNLISKAKPNLSSNLSLNSSEIFKVLIARSSK